MKICLLDPTHPAIGSRIPREHLPPLGLLALGGPLIDAGHQVRLIDADCAALSSEAVTAQMRQYGPDAILVGHSGSTSGHPSAAHLMRVLRQALPQTWIVYGGVFPTFHWQEIMLQDSAIDFIVRGEGEETIVRLITALDCGESLEKVSGIVFREGTMAGRRRIEPGASSARVVANPPGRIIQDLDAFRIGWELIDHRRYTYWGDRRAVVVQFSRGCPHQCEYCGQRSFWAKWRHRDPVRFAAELARLHREQGVQVINFADENPTASREVWRTFLEALIAHQVPLILVGSTRAGDIVRDADILHLYRRAGVARLLMGIESANESTLRQIRKGSTGAVDQEAIRLLRRHGIISMAAWVTGFAHETDRDYWRLLRQILSYDPDQIQALYATPHRWTPFAMRCNLRRVIQPDLRFWDYKHQVLHNEAVPAWRVLVWMKLIEAVAQLRPCALLRLFTHPDKGFRAAMRWYYRIGRRVWFFELRHWAFKEQRQCDGPSLAQFFQRDETGRNRSMPGIGSLRPPSLPVEGSDGVREFDPVAAAS